MYCRSCGKQVRPGTVACPHCGREVEALSGGSGFWDLMGAGRAPAPAEVAKDQTPLQPQPGITAPKQPTPPPQAATHPPAQPERPRQGLQMPLWARFSACAAALLLILLAIALAQSGRMKAQLAEVRGQAEHRETQLAEARGQAESQAAQLAEAREEVEELERQVESLTAEKQLLSGKLEALSRTPAPTPQPTGVLPQVGMVPAPLDNGPGDDKENPLNVTVEPADLSNGVYNVSDKISIRWACDLPDDGDVEYDIWYIDQDDRMKPYIIPRGVREKVLTREDVPGDDIPRPVIIRASRRGGEGESWWRVILIRRKDG